MNLPSVSPNANTPTDTSIRPMPARRAERSSEAVEILASKLISDRDVSQIRHGRTCSGHRHPIVRAVLKTWMPGTSPGHDELSGIGCRAKPSAVPIIQQTLANLAGTHH